MKAEIVDQTNRQVEAMVVKLATKGPSNQPPTKRLRGPNHTPEIGVLWPIHSMGVFLVLKPTNVSKAFEETKKKIANVTNYSNYCKRFSWEYKRENNRCLGFNGVQTTIFFFLIFISLILFFLLNKFLYNILNHLFWFRKQFYN